MEKNIVVFDPETASYKNLSLCLPLLFKNADVHIRYVQTLETFREAMQQRKECGMVIVNFQTGDFWDMDNTEWNHFLESVKVSFPSARRIASTGDPYVHSKLKSDGWHVVFKQYDYRQFRSVLSLENTIVHTITDIKKFVCEELGVPFEKLAEATGKREVVYARQICMYLGKILTHESYTNIAKYFGDRHHTTIIHACNTIKDLMDSDAKIRDQIRRMELSLDTMIVSSTS